MPFASTIAVADLDGTTGFRLLGAAGDRAGNRVAYVGDVDGDGYGDFLVGARMADLAGTDFGAAWLVYGGPGASPASRNLADLTAGQALAIAGPNGWVGWSVGGGMDVDNDGRPDLLVGAPRGSFGATYVIHGRSDGFSGPTLAPGTLDGTTGSILSSGAPDAIGSEVQAIGDVNGDGIADFAVMGLATGEASLHVVFGRDGGFGAGLDLNQLDGTDGFRIEGLSTVSGRGGGIAGGGDINGDGLDDFIVSGAYSRVGAFTSAGTAYVVFGRDTATQGDFAAVLTGADLDGTNGFTMHGFQLMMHLGSGVASLGDLNGDGFDDFAIGARNADAAAGFVAVVFGRDTAVSGDFVASLDPDSLDGSNGFWIVGDGGNLLGSAVAAAGDVNGDGLADLLIGGRRAGSETSTTGAAFVLFGRTGGFEARIGVAELTGAVGFRIDGAAAGDYLGETLSAGDVNGDGLSDIILGTMYAGANGATSGAAYVIYGVQGDLTRIGTAADETLDGNIGDDVLSGLSGRDILNGLAGDDTLDGGDMGDLLNGGDGADDLLGGAGGDVLNGDAGDDGLSGGDAGDKLFGGLGSDSLDGDAGNDRLDGGDGNDVLDGGSDNDLLDGGAGADAMTGGLGNDVFLADDAGDTTLEAANEGFDIVRTALDGWVLAANIEGLELQGSADLDGTGNGGSNNLQGNAGANRLDGGAGVDTINGNDGDDIVVGGLGNDLLRGGTGADVFLVGHVAAGTLETDQIYDFSTAEGDSLDLTDAFAGTLTLVSSFSKVAGQMTLSFAGGITTLRLDTTGDGRVDYQMKINGDVTDDSAGWAL